VEICSTDCPGVLGGEFGDAPLAPALVGPAVAYGLADEVLGGLAGALESGTPA